MKPKKRRSLTALFIPFTHSPITSPLHSPSATRRPSASPTAPNPPATAPILGAFELPPSLSVLTGEKGGRPRTLSQSSIGGRNSKMMNAAHAAVHAIVRASHLGAPEDASVNDTITSPGASSSPTAGEGETSNTSGSGSAGSASNLVPPPSISTSQLASHPSSAHAMSDTLQPAPSRSSSPSSFLLDDDPFANLSPVAVEPKNRPFTSGSSTSTSIIPPSERPKPVHPELVALVGMSSGPLTPVPKSRLQDDIMEEEDDTAPTDQEMMDRGRTKDRGDDITSKKSKVFFAAKSAPTSPSRGYFSSKPSSESTPIPPLPPTPVSSPPPRSKAGSLSMPSSPKMSSRPPAPPPTTRAFTNTRMQRPAHQRPAFVPRPSLPSLDTLARMNVVMAKKVRKGHVGAGLPFEPWDLPSDEEISTPLRRSPRSRSPVAENRTSLDCTLTMPASTSQLSHAEALLTSDEATTPTPTTFLSSGLPPPPSSSTESSVPPPTPQPFLPSQIVALGSLAAEDVEISATGRTSQQSSYPPPRVPLRSSVELSHKSPTRTAAEMHAALVAPVLPPLQLHEVFDVPIPKVPTPEPGQVAEILAAARAQCESPKPVGQDHQTLEGPMETLTYLDKPLPPITAEPDEPIPRWSLETDETHDVSNSTSPTTTRSYTSSRAGSSSDLSSTAASHPYSYGYGYGYGYDDWNAEAGSSSSVPLSRSVSWTSFRSSGGGILYDLGIGESGSDDLRESYSSYPDLVSSTSRTSATNSLLHSPESEWQFGSRPDSMTTELLASSVHPYSLEENVDLSDMTALNDLPLQTRDTKTRSTGAMDLGTDNEPICQATANDQFVDASFLHPSSPPTSNPTPQTSSVDRILQWSVGAVSSDQTSTSSPETKSASLFSPSSSNSFTTLDDADNSQDSFKMTSAATSRMREKLGRSGQRNEHPGFYPNPPPPSVATSRATSNAYSSNHSTHSAAPSKFTSKQSDVFHGEEDNQRRRRKPVAHTGYVSGPASDLTSDDDDFTRYYTQTEVPPSLSGPVARSVSQPAVGNTSSQPQRFPTSSFVSDEDQSSAKSSSSDDDVPLAKRIPGALTAQKSIRKKVREERDAKRVDREARQRERQVTLRPSGAGLASGMAVADLSSSQEAALSASTVSVARLPSVGQEPSPALPQVVPRQRQRTMTMPSKPSAPPLTHLDFGQAFNPDDLAKKLQNVKMMGEMNNASLGFVPSPPQPLSRSRTQTRPSDPLGKASNDPQPHAHATSNHYASPAPPMPLHSTRNHPRPSTVERSSQEARPPSQEQAYGRQRSMSVSRGDRERRPRTIEEPVPPLPLGLNTRVSVEEPERRVLKKPFEARLGSTRTSTEVEQEWRRRPSIGNAPTTPLPEHLDSATKQRVFIHSLQHYHLVNIGPTTSAGDLIAACEAEGVLDGWAGVGSWIVWEIAKDFGMERPVRNYELLADVQASWLKDKTVNYFLLKKSPLAIPLARSAIPSSAPTHSGYVEWESKRGKWSKRWLRLKENGLYLSKRDNGRDETLLCSMSNFDAYYIAHSQRAPKAFSFAVKSTDNLSFFENTADYMQNFSSSEKDGHAWMEKILLARSFVLHEERQVLFNPRGSAAQPSIGASLSRSGTRKTTTSRLQQPLVALPSSDVFQPGSLLSQPGP